MKNLIITLSLLLVFQSVALRAQNHSIDAKGKALIDAVEKQKYSDCLSET